MLFKGGHGGHKKKGDGGPLVGLIRMVLSLFILSILGIGLLLAYRNFSGVNPLTLSPQQLLQSLLSADSAYNLITGLLAFDPKSSLTDAKDNLVSEDPTHSDSSLNNSSDNKEPSAPLAFTFAVMADSHKDVATLKKALDLAKKANAKFIVGMGDLSDVGTIDELRNSKTQYESVNLPFYNIPGDHDLWDSRDKKKDPVENFKEIFGNPYQSFSYEDIRFIIISNSDNYIGMDDLQISWLEQELNRAKTEEGKKLLFVAASTPLYHPSSDHVMGKVTPRLKNQADHLISIFKKAGVNEVFSADTHYFTRYTEPTMDLKMTTVGALTSDRNPQTPRFALVNVYEDGSYRVKEAVVQ